MASYKLLRCIKHKIQRVSALSVVDVPVFFCLCSGCCHVTDVRKLQDCETRAEGCHAK